MEASAKAEVTELKFSGLHVKFGRPAEIRLGGGPLPYPFVQQTPAPPLANAMTEEQHQNLAKAALEHDELLMREEQLARALVEDPDRYEELLSRGELSDDLDSADDEDDE